MKLKLTNLAPVLAVLGVLGLTLALHGKATAARPDGTMPIQVNFQNGGGGNLKSVGGRTNDGDQVTMTVTMSENEVDSEDVPVTYSNLTGPATVTIPAGSDSATITVTTTGNSGDIASATAANENGSAEGSFTIQ
jgi:hypothetical protein